VFRVFPFVYYTLFEEIIEDLQGGGKDSLTKTISTLMNVAMKIEQEKALQASPYERNEERTGQRNGYKDKTLKTRVGEIPVQIPQVRGMEFYPGAIDKGDRSERALKLAIAFLGHSPLSPHLSIVACVDKLAFGTHCNCEIIRPVFTVYEALKTIHSNTFSNLMCHSYLSERCHRLPRQPAQSI
jgi:hypothetical protein